MLLRRCVRVLVAGIGLAVQRSGIGRKKVFLESKTGPGGLAWPLGYNDTITQVSTMASTSMDTALTAHFLPPMPLSPEKGHILWYLLRARCWALIGDFAR